MRRVGSGHNVNSMSFDELYFLHRETWVSVFSYSKKTQKRRIQIYVKFRKARQKYLEPSARKTINDRILDEVDYLI